MLKLENRKQLFTSESPVYTKVRDQVPAIYGIGAKVSNSLVADGCRIYGEVENSILFRGVTVEKGAKIKDSIIMQDTFVGENSSLECVIIDKKAVVKPGKKLCGGIGICVIFALNNTYIFFTHIASSNILRLSS